ncbi:MAG: glycosyltransferase [Solirubrobacteraceae bacterium]
MARILAYTSPARGHLFPLVGILDELHSRGHTISLRTLFSETELMRARGFDCEPLDPAVEDGHDDYLARTPQGALKRALRTFARRAEIDAPAILRAIDRTRPDALLIDVNAWGAQAVAEASGLPWGTWCPFPMPLASRDTPPFGPGLRPARGPAGRLRDALLRPLLTGGYARAFVPAVNEVRAAVGVPNLASPTALFEGAPLVIYMTAEPFEYPRRDWPESVAMVGPCEWEPPAPAPPWLESLSDPIVLVTTSSEYQHDSKLVEAALTALAGQPLTVVATVPAGVPEYLQVPANARVECFIPHGPLLDRAVCAVTHGGMGATQKALARGVPVCAVPFGRDQFEVARRLEVADAGTRLPAGRLQPDRLRAKISEATTKKAGAARIADAFAAAGGPHAAADAVERRLLAPRAGDRHMNLRGIGSLRA